VRWGLPDWVPISLRFLVLAALVARCQPRQPTVGAIPYPFSVGLVEGPVVGHLPGWAMAATGSTRVAAWAGRKLASKPTSSRKAVANASVMTS